MQTYQIETLLLDDEEASLEYSKQVLARYVPESMIHTARTAEETMRILSTGKIHLAFLDVELASSDGFTLCESIHAKIPGVKVVILTGHVDLGAKSYDYRPFDFLVKPVDPMRLERSLKRFLEDRERNAEAAITIESGSGILRLSQKNVLYISKSGNSCLIHLTDGQEHKVSYTLDKLENMFDSPAFFRTHQSFLVSVDHIRKVAGARFGSSYEAVLDDNSVIPVSRYKYTQLKEFILKRSMRTS